MIRVETFTSIGNRIENQDFIAYQKIGDEAGVFVVCDGMGGYDHGDVASKIVAESIVESMTMYWDKATIPELIVDAILYANESLALKKLALACKNMGACMCCVVIDGAKAYFSWFGDCRIYLYRNSVECYCTEDHSMVRDLAKVKALKAEDIEKYSHIVTRSIMGNIKLDPIEMKELVLQPDDKLLLCTDGLHKSVNLPIRWTDNLIVELKSRNDNFDDNATCLTIKL